MMAHFLVLIIFFGVTATLGWLFTPLFFKIPENRQKNQPEVEISRPFYSQIGAKKAEKSKPMLDQQERYSVELKLFRSVDNTLKYLQKLGEMNIEAYYTPYSTQNGVIFKVRSGVFMKRREANQHQVNIAHLLKLKPQQFKIVAL